MKALVHARRNARLAAALTLLLLVPCVVVRAGDALDKVTQELAEKALGRLSERFKQLTGDPEEMRNDLLKMIRTYPGTAQALKASALVAQLPSALDRLDPQTIPPLERFPWQPKELIGILGEHRGRHGAPVGAVAFSPDGKWIASVGGSYLRLWDPATMRLALQYSQGGHALAWSKQSDLLIVGYANGIAVYDVVSGPAPLKLRFQARDGSGGSYGIALRPDNKKVAMACFDTHVRVFDISGAKAVEPVLVQGHTQAATCVAYSPDGNILATGSADKTLRFWDAKLEIPKKKGPILNLPAGANHLTYNPAGTTLACVAGETSIRLWTVSAGTSFKERAVVGDPKIGRINHLVYSDTGNTLAAACADGTVRLWSMASVKPGARGRVEGHLGAVMSVMLAPGSKMLVTGGADWTVRTWDITGTTHKERFVPWSHLSSVNSSAFSPDSSTLVSGSVDTGIRLWDVGRPEPRARKLLKGEGVPIYSVVYSPDGARLAVGSTQAVIRQYEAASGKPLKPVSGLPSHAQGLTYSPDGSYLFHFFDQVLYLYDSASGTEARRFTGHTTRIHSAGYAPDGKHLVSASGGYWYRDGKIVEINGVKQYTDCTVRLWNAEKGTEVACVKTYKLPVVTAFFSPDSKHFFAGSSEPTILERPVARPEEPGKIAFPGLTPGSGIRFSPDGSKLLSWSGTYKVWDIASWKVLWEGSFAESVSHVTFASDSRHLAFSLGTGVVYIVRLGPPAYNAGGR